MDDLVVVGGADRAGDLDRVGDGLADRQAAVAANAVLDRLALDVLEDNVRSGRVLPGVVHADYVRAVELRDGACLPAEALELVGVRGDFAVHQLDRDLALEHRVEGAVDGRHPACADLRVQAVAPREQGADLRAHVSIVRVWAPFMSRTSQTRRVRGPGRPNQPSDVCRWSSPRDSISPTSWAASPASSIVLWRP